jgi:hypothetical protein
VQISAPPQYDTETTYASHRVLSISENMTENVSKPRPDQNPTRQPILPKTTFQPAFGGFIVLPRLDLVKKSLKTGATSLS